MRLKVLFFPLALIISVFVAINYIWPEVDNVKLRETELEAKRAELKVVQDEKKNIDSLESSLNQNKTKEDFVLNYLPQDGKEESVINTINYVANGSSVSLVSLSVKKTEEPKATAQEPAESASGLFSSLGGAATTEQMEQEEVIRTVEVTGNIIGKYKDIKIFIDQIERTDMFNNISSFVISKDKSKAASTEGEQANDPEMLSAEIGIKFGFLPKKPVSSRLSAGVFSKSTFDFSQIDKVINFSTSKVSALGVGTKGRTNPFLP